MDRAVAVHGHDWVAVAAAVGRPSGQCYSFWERSQTHGTARSRWDTTEVEALQKAVASLGRRWGLVAAVVKTKTEKQCLYKGCVITSKQLESFFLTVFGGQGLALWEITGRNTPAPLLRGCCIVSILY